MAERNGQNGRRLRPGSTDDTTLAIGEWAVLGAVVEGPTHGYKVSQLLAPDAALGRIWTLTRQNTYLCIKKLVRQGLIAERSTEPGRGPGRTILAATAKGKRTLTRWLLEPVDHIRDGRTLLLLKLTLLDRTGADITPLIETQRARFEPIVEALEAECRQADPVDAMFLRWRLESSRAALDFLRYVAESRRQPET